MGKLRGILFLIAFYVLITFFLIILAPTLVMPQRAIHTLYRLFCLSLSGAMRLILGVTYDVRGREHLTGGSVVVASKHQSIWETFAFCLIFERPSFVLKEELMRIPLFGSYLTKLGMVPIVRGSGHEALTRMKKSADEMIAANRTIVIYPEGTRRLPGAPPQYKSGVAHLYRDFGLPVLPVALNSGVFWPKHGIPRGPGKIIVDIGAPIATGLPPGVFRARLRDRVEAACDALLVETAEHHRGLIGEAGVARLAQLRAGDTAPQDNPSEA